jgi:hypothetical protein
LVFSPKHAFSFFTWLGWGFSKSLSSASILFWYWGLNSGSHTCKASVMGIFEIGAQELFAPGLVLNHDYPDICHTSS